MHPVHDDYIPGAPGGDGEEPDVYIFVVAEPLKTLCAKISGIVYRESTVKKRSGQAGTLCFI